VPLYIKDPEVSELARRYQKLSKAPTKTDAVRRALQHAIDDLADKPGLADIAVGLCRDLRAKANPSRSKSADKAFIDSLYE
jgi:antitoxin VapB